MILERPRSIVIACDIDIDKFGEVLLQTKDIEHVGAYQISASLCLRYGLKEVSAFIEATGKKRIYENGTLGAGRPEDAEPFADLLQEARIDAANIFPISGMEVGEAWIAALISRGIAPIVRGLQTYRGYTIQEGGYVEPQAWRRIYDEAVQKGVRDLQVPANRHDDIDSIRRNIEALEEPEIHGISEGKRIVIDWYPTGFGRQGGKIRDMKTISERVHPVIGGLITNSSDIRGATLKLVEELETAYQ